MVTGIDTNYMSGPVATAISKGILARPVVFRTHGGRARAIEFGQLKIDVAFLAAPAADDYGNINGIMGPAACGSLGYAYPDAEYASTVVAVTDFLVEYPLTLVSIPQTRVDYVVVVDSIGDPQGIVAGTTRITKDPIGLKFADTAAKVIEAAGMIKDGFSFQTGAGGATADLQELLREAGIVTKDIYELKALAEKIAGRPSPVKNTGRIVAIMEYRDGTFIDTIRKVET